MTTSNGFLSRDEFFATSKKRRFREVPHPFLEDRKWRIRSLMESEWAAIDVKTIDFKKGGLSVAGLKLSDIRLVIAAVCDSDGQPIFTDADEATLADTDTAVFIPLVREIKEHCGLRSGGEDSLKNSNATGGEGSPCSSAELSPALSTG